ncbi:MAG: phosphatidylserine decarboxylase [Acidobacteria bacterium]|nr:phosphatidylserine decarboxylase [Acidobacteriota bacterium]
MVRDGIYYAIALLGLSGFAVYWGGWMWGVPEWLLTAFVLNFFRDPERPIPPGNGVVSPADGKVVDVRQFDSPTGRRWKISIFLNVFDVHVNRAPVAGRITEQVYRRGKFLVASVPEASTENEQNAITIDASDTAPQGHVVMKQIAGLVARRIVPYKKVGDTVARGERIGLIKFGSRVDLELPASYKLLIKVGDRVRAAASLIAEP